MAKHPTIDSSTEHTALKRREKQFRTLVENIPGVVYRCACDEHWTMKFVSETIYQLSGYPADEFINNRVRSYASIIHRGDQALVDRAVAEGTAARQPYIIDYRIVDANGTIHWVHEKGQGVFSDDGKLLWLDGAIFDVTDRKTAEEKLLAEQTLLRKLLGLRERERKLIAYDIHDGLVQDIVGAKLLLEAMAANQPAATKQCADRLDTIVGLLAHAIDEGRRVISDLRPLIIDEHGILAAIQYLVEEANASAGGPAIELVQDVQFKRLASLIEGTIFRIVQEALNNVRRHSGAKKAHIRITQPGSGDLLRIEISDDGVGFDQTNVPHDRFGLRGIVERARLFGGSATIESTLNRGTRVLVELPLRAPVSQ